MRGQEILSGGQRINDPQELKARLLKKGIDPASSGIKEVSTGKQNQASGNMS